MNNLLYDGIATQGTKTIANHGGAEYAKYVLRQLINRSYSFDIVFYNSRIVDPAIAEIVTSVDNITVFYVNSKAELYDLIDKNGYSRFYSALPYDYGDYKCNATLVGVIHGLRSIELPWDDYKHKYFKGAFKKIIGCIVSKCTFLQKYLKQQHIKKFDQLLNVQNASFITVSQHSKYALLNFYPQLQPENIEVFYSPFEVNESVNNDCDRDYYLIVSANRFEKNAYRVIKSFDKLFSDGRLKDKRVVATGCNGVDFMRVVKNKSKFEFLPYVSLDQLESLYSNAFCFVYPSLNEGFGYPPLQAMSYGVPVIASSSTSIPEVCQDAALMFSPTSCDDLCNRILQIDLDEVLRARCIERGRARVADLQKMQIDNVEKMISYIIV